MKRIVLTGLNGYGGNFIEPLLESDGSYKLTAVVSRSPEKSLYYERLKEYGVKFYSSLEACLEKETLDMAILTTPMHIHYKEVMCALQHKLSVYCEKPLACTLEQCKQIEQYAKEQGCIVAVGYQWSHSKAITMLKKQLLSNQYGKLLRIKTLVLWNRPKSYYENSDWKGCRNGADGMPIWESVMSNGAAHFLHNILFLAGEELEKAAYPVEITGNCYRAHQIETFDTACIKMKTESGCELLYLATLVAEQTSTPEFVVECEKAKIYYPAGEKKEIAVEYEDGKTIYLGSPDEERFTHFRKVVKASTENTTVNCTAETTLPIASVIDYVMNHIDTKPFAKEAIVENGDTVRVIGLEERMRKCYETVIDSLGILE